MRFAILGAGFMGATYAECLAHHVQGGELVVIAGGRRAPGLAERYGVDFAADVRDAIARPDVDAVVVASPHSAHLEQAVFAASLGKHVYAEKPLARTVADCDSILAACVQAPVALAVNSVTRFRDSPLAAKRLLTDGDVGELRMIRGLCAVPGYLEDGGWTADPEEGGAWLDWGVHGCDTLRWLTGSEPVEINGWAGDFGPGPALLRSAAAQFVFANGVVAQLLMTFESPSRAFGSQSFWQIIGSLAVIELDAYGRVELVRGDRRSLVHVQERFNKDSDTLSPIRLKAFAAQLSDFVAAVREGRAPAVTGEDGRKAVAMVEAVKHTSHARA
ncbi:MAG TPA: Gfo/Idh/MocA family oxidoreductase [Candidatus Dormibacteraeota bacterium]|nr:Gfo/Idh/MocA family oxidoreductase [Candidatus Dormibacteraeota bacterium]